MAWLFVLGVSLELAGALLVAAALLLPVLRRQWDRLALRGYLFPRGGPGLNDVLEPAYVAVGAVLLFGGFVAQLSGYVVEFASDALIAAAALTAVAAFTAGVIAANKLVAPALLRQAKTHDPVGGRPGRHGAL